MTDYQLAGGFGMIDYGNGVVERWEIDPDGKERRWTENYKPRPRAEVPCRVYWGSHGCRFERDHKGPCECDCALDEGIDPETREYVDDPGLLNVGAPPYYGPETRFYGEDVEARGLPAVKERPTDTELPPDQRPKRAHASGESA